MKGFVYLCILRTACKIQFNTLHTQFIGVGGSKGCEGDGPGDTHQCSEDLSLYKGLQTRGRDSYRG